MNRSEAVQKLGTQWESSVTYTIVLLLIVWSAASPGEEQPTHLGDSTAVQAEQRLLLAVGAVPPT